MERKRSSAYKNPILSQALTHLTDVLTAMHGRKYVESILPSIKEVLQDKNSPTSKAYLAHVRLTRMVLDIETSVADPKAEEFVYRIGNDKDVFYFFMLLRQLFHEIGNKEVQRKKKALENQSRLQPENLTGSGLKILNRACKTYYDEERTAIPGSSVDYDPIFSLPPGVQPSEVLKIRMSSWQDTKRGSSSHCRCSASKSKCLIVAGRRQRRCQHRRRLIVAVPRHRHRRIVRITVPQQLLHLFLVGIPQASQEPLCISNASPTSIQKVGKIFKYIDTFINKLFNSTSQEMSEPQNVVNIALRLIQELLDSSFFKATIPLLVTLLHGTVTLTASSRTKAYQFLVDSLTKICEREDISAFERWFLKGVCVFLKGDCIPMGGEFADLPTALSKFVSTLFTEKSKELVSEATNSACSKGGRSPNFILEPLISFYVSHIGLHPAQRSIRSVICYLKGLNLLQVMDQDNSPALNEIVKATWLNSELSGAAAKVFTYLLPRDNLSMLNNVTMLVIPPEECNLKVYKCEKEIESKVTSNKMSHHDAALWYLDLMVMEESICTADEEVLCLLKAGQHLAYEFSQVAKDQSRRHVLKNAVIMLAHDASQLAMESLLPGLRIFALNTAYHLIRFVSHISDVTQHSCPSGRVATGLLKNLRHSANFTFLISQPMTADDFLVAAAPYIRKVTNEASSAYIQQLLQIPEKMLPIQPSVLHHHVMEVCYLSGHVQQPHFQEKRIAAMTALLSETQWNFEGVTKAMLTDMFQRTDEGFIKREEHLCKNFEIAELKGIVFNDDEHNPSIHVVIKPAKGGNGVLSYKDIIELLQLTVSEASTITFSLDRPCGTERYHPFMTLRCNPRKLQDTDFMKSLFHADYLLKFFSTGVEVSAKYPYKFKPVRESLIKDLPDSLNFLRFPPYAMGKSHMSRHRFWIEIEEVTYDKIKSKNQLIYYIGEVKVQVKSRPMVVTPNGNTVDAKHSEQGPHALFAHKLTENYEGLSKRFPIFARVKELAKLQFLAQKHHAHLKNLETESPKLFESVNNEVQRLHSLHPLESNPDSCRWVPATFNNLVYGGVLSSFRSSHVEYFSRSGADLAEDACDAEQAKFSDVHKVIAPLREGLGGIKIQLNRLLKTHVSREELETEYMCVKLSHDLKRSSVDKPETAQDNGEQDTGDIPGVIQQPHEQLDIDSTSESLISKVSADDKIAHQESPINLKERTSELSDAESIPKSVSTPTNQMNYKLVPAESVESKQGVQKEPDFKNGNVTDYGLAQGANDEEEQTSIAVEFDVDSVMSLAAQNQISFQRKGAKTDSLLPQFSQSLLNKVIFGETLNHLQLKCMLLSEYNFDDIDFHPNVLACHLIRTAIVLRKIVEYHYKRGTERQMI